jgi:phospholipid transport system substrate-binding protein
MRQLIVFPFLLLASAPAHAEAEPMAVVQRLVEAIRSFERAENGKSLQPDQVAKNEGVIERAHGTLDVQGLAERSLGDTWSSLDRKQRSDFIRLLKQVFAEVAYPQSSKFFEVLELEYDDAGERRGKHVIAMEVSHPDEGLIDIDFFLTRIEGEWKVVDIHLDGVSLATNIRTQMQEAIAKGGYDNLIEKMKAKLDA